jgi:hypothetical protein
MRERQVLADRVSDCCPADLTPARQGRKDEEPVLGVPLVAPGVRFAREAGLLTEDDAAQGVVFVADVAGPGP